MKCSPSPLVRLRILRKADHPELTLYRQHVREFPDMTCVFYRTCGNRTEMRLFDRCESTLFFGKQQSDLPCPVRDQDSDR